MSKITFNYDGKDYRLEYTKQSVKTMEQRGFVASRILEAPMTTLPELFAGAFLANHKYTDRKVIDAIYDKMTDKKQLIETLTQMYNEPIASLMQEPEDSAKNVDWMASW